MEAARLTLEEAARHVDRNRGHPETAAGHCAELLVGDTAFDVAASLTEACGLGAVMRGSELERLLRDARCGAVMPPSSDIAAKILGASGLGLHVGLGAHSR